VIDRIEGDRRPRTVGRRVDRPEAVLLAIAQATLAAVGWLVDPFWVAVMVAVQLAVGGLGAVRVMGPARGRVGLARYAMPATAGVAATLFGRVLPGGVAVLLVPLVAVLLWAVIYVEVRATRVSGGRTILELLLTATLFAAATGVLGLFGDLSWPTPAAVIAVFAVPLALRSAESRGALGGQAVGQALLHLLAVAQVGTATLLLDLPGVATVPALMALAFYAWAGAVQALRAGEPGRSVAVEFGSLAVLGLVVALLLHRG
jgi:hypothetical protein